MLVLKPRRVSFGSSDWDGVTSVAIERSSARLVAEWGDLGPYAAMADVPEQRVGVRVVQEMLGDDMDEPRPGELATLSFVTQAGAGTAGGRLVSMSAMVESVDYRVSVRNGSERTVRLVALSSDGTTDPVSVSNA